MEESKNVKEYKTSNLSLCPYLCLKGFKYLRAEPSLGKNDRPTVLFVFEDKLGLGKDVELDFMNSEFKQYRDLHLFFRSEIEKLKRQLEKLNREEERKKDDKYADEYYEEG